MMNANELQAAVDCVMYVLSTTDLDDAEHSYRNLTDEQRIKMARGMLYPFTSRGQINR